ncbi:[protein-PII] uridylyltransferase [Mycobacterium fragae]|uniref:Bifunctional uridylyltransferase/uridylyl-removing enzyme n=1 Tax=Mycobacterium fragae TaxID=1260918 RepID=A0A1X1UX53_9MYCO|nr:[protein-PII] uridylyltransferase [Mycobacterium fragae]MCV7400487.1 [protein-PII] uridylyltransferase [Mycobacterium fragae]ORV61329.1 protein-PII uridylyltransferase [Mycobacterium fragae]
MTQRGVDPLGPLRLEATADGNDGAASDLAAAREQLLSSPTDQLDSAALREVWGELHEFWLTSKAAQIGITADSGFAIVATGSLGRRELLPYSDLDLLLLHDGLPPETVQKVADQLWYPLWDANIRLDHSVRTVAETLRVAGADVSAGLAMLDARHIAGDEQLSARLVEGVRQQWRTGIRSLFGELVESTHARWRRSGEIAHRAEPDLKLGRGGLRDVQLLDALAIAQLADRLTVRRPDHPMGSLTAAHLTLLNVRTELHRVSGRGHDLLLAQYADEISAAMHVGDRYDLARTLSDAGRTISYRVDAGLRTAANAMPRRGMSAMRRRPRRPLDEGVVEYAGEIVLARDARPQSDPALVLRVAAASAVTGLPIAESTLSRLADIAPELRTPWPREAFDNLLVLLTAGPATVATIEALDRNGLWGRLFPEWGAVRDLPPRDVIHIWTVDRHLAETAARARIFTTRVARPDLLILSALLHDIGKGRDTDHSVLGAQLATQVGTRLGMWPSDVEMLSKLVEHHLLLSKIATRHDLNDPQTIASVCEALGGDPVLLDVLHALTEADALATGPGVWSDWKASLVGDLVRRCRLAMAGEQLPQADPLDPTYLSLAADGEVYVELRPGASRRTYHVVMIAPDQRGLLSKAAGVLALNSLRVHSASMNIHEGAAIDEFVVSPHFGSPVGAELLREQFIRALDGDVDVLAALGRRETDPQSAPIGDTPTGIPVHGSTAPPRIIWFNGTPGRLMIEIRATDRTGLLALLTGALERAGADILWAKVTTLGSMVDDVFCVSLPDHADARAVVERHLLAVLDVPGDVAPV